MPSHEMSLYMCASVPKTILSSRPFTVGGENLAIMLRGRRGASPPATALIVSSARSLNSPSPGQREGEGEGEGEG